ncbi:MAG TPA: hypothetical protein VMH28_26030 [Candidatus Acidoferrales bacterium]|nr:hypothetical protein [Candidatus Acidoferrales bacterium]
MSTPAQIAANRANAQKSTGPRTPEGQSRLPFQRPQTRTRRRLRRHPGEDPAEYEALANDFRRQFHPASALEHFHVETLIRSAWLKRRLQRTEAKLYRALFAEGSDPEDLDVATLTNSPTAKLIHKVFAQIASLDRAFFAAIKELRRIQTVDEGAYMDLRLDAPLPLDRGEICRLSALSESPSQTLLARDLNPALRL